MFLKLSLMRIHSLKTKVKRNLSSFKKLKWIQRPILEHVHSLCSTRAKAPSRVICELYPEDAMTGRTCEWWFAQFREGAGNWQSSSDAVSEHLMR